MIMGKPVNYVVEADIAGFFDHVDHAWMRRCLSEHIADPRFLNLITQMLKTEVAEEGKITKTKEGTPQGGIISPILANVYLHYVLDLWFEIREKKEITGYAQLVRYADDFVIGCQNKREAEKGHKGEIRTIWSQTVRREDADHRVWPVCSGEQEKTERETGDL